jgi:hypothetical protein
MVNQDGTSGSDWSQASNPSQSGGSIYMVAVDMDNGTAWWGKDGSWFANSSGTTANPASNAGAQATGLNDGTTWFPFSQQGDQTAEAAMAFNFGADNTFAGAVTSGQDASQSEFYYAPPNGFKSLNTSNLADPAVTPAENFAAETYVGNNGDEEINLGFTPALTWIKNRDDNYTYHGLYDSVRGLSAGALHIQETSGEESPVRERVASFDSDTGSEGFTLSSSNYTYTNASGKDYISWNWKAHQSPSSSGSAKQKYKFYCEDLSGDEAGWDHWGYYTDSSGKPSINMEVLENQNGTRVSLGYVYVLYNGDEGIGANQAFTVECADIDAIEIRWHYDDSNDSTSDYTSDNTESYTAVNTILNAQRLTVYSGAAGTTQEFQVSSAVNTNSQDNGVTSSYSPPTGWADDDVIRAATASNTDSSTYASSSDLTDGFTAAPVEKYNDTAGFSIITYSGNGSSDGDTQEITHTLGAEPEFIIAKSRSSSASEGSWHVYHKHAVPYSDSGYGTHAHLHLNQNWTAYQLYYNILIPKSGSEDTIINTVYDSSDALYTNESGVDYVMYAWAGVEGYSKFGKYTGNGVADGPFIYTGFRPAFVLWKRSTGSNNSWNIMDNKREGYNPQNDLLFPDSSTNESDVTDQDLLSNGFKLRTTGAGRNANNETFIYAAFAESPFKYANAR